MSEQPTEPVWLFQHRDRTGSIFRAATGLIRMIGADGQQVTMHLTGPESLPLDPRNLVAAISHVVGGQIVSVPAVPDGWLVEENPTRIRVGNERWKPEDAEELAGRLATALLTANREKRQANLQVVRRKAEVLAGVSGERYDALPSAERVMWEDAARRDLAAQGPA